MNLAIDNESPSDITSGADLEQYLIGRMNVMKSSVSAGSNTAFYTADGFRYEIPTTGISDCTTANPCIIGVDVNGDRGPTTIDDKAYLAEGTYPQGDDERVPDFFAVMVTDVSVQPYGAVAQRTMYQADSN